MQLQIYKAVIDPNPSSDLEVNFIGLVDRPAIERNFQAFNEQKQKIKFTINEEKRIISGPAMIAGLPLYRNDDQLGEYYVVFEREDIQAIVEKFSSKGYLKNFNLFHDEQQQVSDVTIFNSFISDKTLGIQPLAGFDDLPDGSWFISAKVNNTDVWNKVKEGMIKGFSVEGIFTYIPVKNKAKMYSNELTPDDVCFLQEMIPNHQMALAMAVQVGKSSKLYDFAQKIIKTQSAEIELMKSWIEANSGVVPLQMSEEKAVKMIEKILNEIK